MRASRLLCASAMTMGMLAAPPAASAQESAQSLQAQIDQLKRDFETLKQQYGDRLTALEAKLATLPGAELPAPVGTPTPAIPAPPQPATAQVPAGTEGACGPSRPLPWYRCGPSPSDDFQPDHPRIGGLL